MASIHCTGRVDCFVDLGPGVKPLNAILPAGPISYLGTAEIAPDLEFRDNWAPVQNDISSRSMPFDRQFQGSDAMISIDLNRFNYGVVQAIKNRTSKVPFTAGTEPPYARGTYLLTNGIGFKLWLRNAFFGGINAADYIENGSFIPPGYFFPCCVMEARFPEVIGLDTHKVKLMIHAHPWWDVQSQDFYLYTQEANVFNGLPAIN